MTDHWVAAYLAGAAWLLACVAYVVFT